MGRTAAAVFFTAGLAGAFLAGALAGVLAAVFVTFLAGAFALVAMVKIRSSEDMEAACSPDIR
ncbi:hypothetical protein DVA63_09960 [Bordetella pertussis]|nr:hypothetical protein AL474_19765 [Bordetella pertussis]PNO98079.1 hypothetical protein AL465_003665 [Bordetella pertussis 18323]AXK02556.1 hypothetical protein DVA61_09970 [Bordetella pertussis]AXK06121.1 hypothetical protein DVA62_09990 [Bordetella pertussis]AXK09687.1 hypothetical protein DVA63_09960 [Bordetella pertussis]